MRTVGRSNNQKRRLPMSAEENKAIVRRMIEEAWNKGNLAVVEEIVAPSYIGHDPSYPMPIQGSDGFKQYVSMTRTAFPDFRITVEDLIAEGDKVVGRITVRGTNTGSVMGMPPTGKQVTISGIFIRRLAGGRFVEGWDAPDTLSLMQQLGVIPTPQQGGS
jgi:steroid delta-isomerase-like uncharacterized protein